MIDFDLSIKTKIYFGPDKEELIGDILSNEKVQRVLIIIGEGSVIGSNVFITSSVAAGSRISVKTQDVIVRHRGEHPREETEKTAPDTGCGQSKAWY